MPHAPAREGEIYSYYFCASSNDLEHGAGLMIGGSGSLFDVKPLGVDVAGDVTAIRQSMLRHIEVYFDVAISLSAHTGHST